MLKSQKGFSLIEVVASILLITIILISFFGLFVQSNKTKNVSKDIVDITYLAQNEVEHIYSYVQSQPNLASTLSALKYNSSPIEDSASRKEYVRTDTTEQLTYTLILKEVPNQKDLTGIIVKVQPINENKKRAQLETIIKWQVF